MEWKMVPLSNQPCTACLRLYYCCKTEIAKTVISNCGYNKGWKISAKLR